MMMILFALVLPALWPRGGRRSISEPCARPSSPDALRRPRMTGGHAAASSTLLVLFLLTGCMQTFSTLQRVETTIPGESAFAVGSGATAAFNLEGTEETALFPTLDLGIRQGLNDNMDIGGRLWPLALTGTVDLKYRLLGGPIEAAIIPGIGASLPGLSRVLPFLHLGHSFQLQAYGLLLVGVPAPGGKLLFAPKFNAFLDQTAVVLLPGAMIGYDFDLGHHGNLVPEINLHCSIGHGACYLVANVGMFY